MGLHAVDHAPLAWRDVAAIFLNIVSAGILKFCGLSGQLLLDRLGDVHLRGYRTHGQNRQQGHNSERGQ